MFTKARRSIELRGADWKAMVVVPIVIATVGWYSLPDPAQSAPESGQSVQQLAGQIGDGAVQPAIQAATLSKDIPKIASWPLKVVPGTDSAFRAKYGYLPPNPGPNYPKLSDVPADLRAYCLATAFTVADALNVPDAAILGVHWAEQMGHGWQCLMSHISRSDAVGPGQVTPGFWNGWYNQVQSQFVTDPGSICPCTVMANGSWIKSPPGFGTDFDGDGIADPWTLADNMAATARHFAYKGITKESVNQADYYNRFLDAMAFYGNGTAYADPKTPAIKRVYAKIGADWAALYNTRAKILALAHCEIDSRSGVTCFS